MKASQKFFASSLFSSFPSIFFKKNFLSESKTAGIRFLGQDVKQTNKQSIKKITKKRSWILLKFLVYFKWKKNYFVNYFRCWTFSGFSSVMNYPFRHRQELLSSAGWPWALCAQTQRSFRGFAAKSSAFCGFLPWAEPLRLKPKVLFCGSAFIELLTQLLRLYFIYNIFHRLLLKLTKILTLKTREMAE